MELSPILTKDFSMKFIHLPLKLYQLGQSLVELMVVIGLFALVMPPILLGLISTRDGRVQEQRRVKAISLMKEAQEAARSARNSGWSNISSLQTNTSYHPVAGSNSWSFALGQDTASNVTRSVVFSDVCRNDNGAGTIVNCPAGGTVILDPSSKKVVITISWAAPIPNSISSTMYLTRYQDNFTYGQSTQAEFNTDTLASVQVTNSSGGEVVLATNTKAKWCAPSFSQNGGGGEVTIDLPDGPPVAVAARADATDVSIPNDVLVATSPLTSNSVKMAYVNVVANTDPPSTSLRGVFTLDSSQYSASGLVPSGIGLDNTFKTTAIKYYTAPSGKLYALIGTDQPTKEVIAILVNDNNPSNDNNTTGEFQDVAGPNYKIFKYWTYFNTARYGSSVPTPTLTPTNTPMPTATPTPTPPPTDTGFLNPSANAAETTNAGDNNGFDSNPTRAYSNNASFAVDNNSGTTTSTNCADNGKDKHRFYNYNVSIPAWASVNGITVQLDARVDNTTPGAPVMCVQLSWDGGSTWTSAKTTAALTTTEASYTLGGAADTWGRSWTNAQFTNANLRVRVIDVASNNTRDFSLDWVALKVHYNGVAPTSTPMPTPTNTPTPTPAPTSAPGPNDQAPFGAGASAITVSGDRGYIASGGFLYTFNLSDIDSKSASNALTELGCRIELDGYDCRPQNGGTPGLDAKYNAGQSGATWSNTATPAHPDCSDGGNIELRANNDIYPVSAGGNTYIYVAVGAGTNPEFNIANVSSVPSSSSTPTLTSNSCGTAASGNASWKTISSLDFNTIGSTEEAANSVFAKADGTRAYVSSNGGIDANRDGIPDSKQFYIINTTNKSSPQFLSGSPNGGPTSGYYYGGIISPTPTGPIYNNDQMYPRRSLTVLNGQRAVLVGQKAIPSVGAGTPTPTPFNTQEYQVVNIDPADPAGNKETTPTYCGGVDYDQGFNDLTSVTEADLDTFVYMVANTQDHQLKIIQGGPDGTYTAAGTIESPTYALGHSTAFNRFTATTNIPSGTNVQFQFALADPPGGNCNGVTFNYTGPDGQANSYYPATGGTLFLNDNGNGYINPGSCFRYKAFLSTTTPYNSTPTFNDITVNYSP